MTTPPARSPPTTRRPARKPGNGTTRHPRTQPPTRKRKQQPPSPASKLASPASNAPCSRHPRHHRRVVLTDPTVKNWAAWGGAVPAGAYLLDTDSKVYQNVSGNVLTTPPTGMPGGPGPWTHLWKPLVAAGGGAWAAGVAYKTGDLATYQASTYKCLQGHTSQPGWEPPAVPAIWQKQ